MKKIKPASLYFFLIFGIAALSMLMLGFGLSESRARISSMTEEITSKSIPASLESIKAGISILDMRNNCEKALFGGDYGRIQTCYTLTKMLEDGMSKSGDQQSEKLKAALSVIKNHKVAKKEEIKDAWLLLDMSIGMYSGSVYSGAFSEITQKLKNIESTNNEERYTSFVFVAAVMLWQFLLLLSIYFVFVKPLSYIERKADGVDEGSWVDRFVVSAIREMNSLLMAVKRLHDATSENQKMSKTVADEMIKAKVFANEKADFLSSMTHEIKTPLASISAMIFALEKTSLSEDQRHYVTQMGKSSYHLTGLVERVLSMSKMDANRLEIVPAKFRLDDMVTKVVNMTIGLIERKHLQFSCFVDPSVPSVVIGDELRISEILLNYLNNSIKCTSKGSIRIEIRCESIIKGNATLNLAVIDTGEGVDEKNVPFLFKKFSQFEKRTFGGTGLGLSITKGLVDLMGGQVGVKTIKNVGSHFWATIVVGVPAKAFNESSTQVRVQANTLEPSRRQAMNSESTRQVISDIYYLAINDSPLATHMWLKNEQDILNTITNANSVIGDLFRKFRLRDAAANISKLLEDKINDPSESLILNEDRPTILVIDDTAPNIDLLYILLNDLGSIKATPDPDGGILIAQSLPANSLIILDVSMPIKNGFDVIRELKASDQTKDIPVVMISASESEDTKNRCLEGGAVEFIDRGKSPEYLIEVIAKLVKSL